MIDLLSLAEGRLRRSAQNATGSQDLFVTKCRRSVADYDGAQCGGSTSTSGR
jgi:hypothetical protein